jgi:MinD superfamily P-loop ATPase
MRIVVASGKGGTGKTTVAVNLAIALAGMGRPVVYADCDVEEPNGHIFLKPDMQSSEEVGVPVPIVDLDACTACGECSRICRFSAIVTLGQVPPLTYPELCKGCGGCLLVCKDGAITEGVRTLGVIEKGTAARAGGAIDFIHGRLRVGEAQSPPLIRRVKEAIPAGSMAVLDAPPGTSCPVVETVRDGDFVLLVTEPTPFGLNDLRLAVEMTRVLEVPFAVAVNRSGVGNDGVADYCAEEGIRVLFEMKDDRRIAEAYSRGEAVLGSLPEYGALFERLGGDIVEAAA